MYQELCSGLDMLTLVYAHSSFRVKSYLFFALITSNFVWKSDVHSLLSACYFCKSPFKQGRS